MKPKMTQEVRNTVRDYIKSKKDISPLIENYSLKGEDLSGAIIQNFNRANEDLSNINLARAIIGAELQVTDISYSNISGGNLYRTKFLGKVKANRVKAVNTNFNRAYFPHADYQYADFSGASFCGATFTIDGGSGKGCKFPKEVLEQLMKDWEVS